MVNIQTKVVEKKKKKKIWLISVISVILLAVVASIGISIFVGLSLTMPEKDPIDASPKDVGLNFEDISFLSHDQETELSGWVIHPVADPKMTIIFAHGYKGDRVQDNVPFLPLAKDLVERGYRIILFDFRNSGLSEGEMTTIGVKEKLDLLGAIQWVKSEYDDPIGLLGISMGASTSILAAAEDKDVVGVVADSPFSDLRSYLEENMPVWTNLPNFPFTPLILSIVPMIADIDIDEASPINVLDSFEHRPILFIHSKDDTAIPYTESKKMVEKNQGQFDVWLTEKADHVKSYSLYPDEYVERVDEFFNNILNQ